MRRFREMIDAKDLEAIEKIKAEVIAQGFTEPHIDISGYHRKCPMISMTFYIKSSQMPEGSS
jgi:hypothetical protein